MGLRQHALLALSVLLAPACSDDTTSEREAACARLDERSLWSIESIPASTEGGCERPTLRDLSDHEKVAVAVYHFNIQYVAGGLIGFPDGEVVPTFNLDEEQVEDRIVKEGLEPVLDMFLDHPTFAADIELQGYMVEVMAKRHPDVLAKMRTLAQRGQIDFDSFHYSDQLYVAYPKEDLEQSIALTKRIFERVCVPMGRSIFTQEGQFAKGQLPLAAAQGYSVSILAKNLFKVQKGDDAANESVLYEAEGVENQPVILGGQSWTASSSVAGGPFQLRWMFMDDGEIAFTENNLNPYFGLDYVVDPNAITEHIQQLEDLEAKGFVFATVAEAVSAMKKRGIASTPLPEVLDGTWQPANTQNVFRWMGGSGLFRSQESDSAVLGATYRASRAVREARAALGDSESVSAAQRELSLSQVSDSTGWNPFRNEVVYSLDHAQTSESIARDALACAGEPPLVEWACSSPEPVSIDTVGLSILAPTRPIDVTVNRCANGGAEEIVEVVIDIPKTIDEDPLLDESADASKEREIELRLDRDPSAPIALPMALDDTFREIDLDAYAFEDFSVPVPHGVIGLGGGRYLIQDMGTGRQAALIARTTDMRDFVRFVDMTVRRSEAQVWRVLIVSGTDDDGAMKLSKEVNGL